MEMMGELVTVCAKLADIALDASFRPKIEGRRDKDIMKVKGTMGRWNNAMAGVEEAPVSMFHVGSCKVIVLKVLGSKAASDDTRREQVREGHWIGPVVGIGPRIMAVGVGPCSGPVVGPDRIELVLDMIIQRSSKSLLGNKVLRLLLGYTRSKSGWAWLLARRV
ncbi:hypothetical protein Tco_0759928 [Tanacetum coccineum]